VKILVADDDPVSPRMIERMLQQSGCNNSVTLRRGKEAFRGRRKLPNTRQLESETIATSKHPKA
jgi:CheY-like chemotaxis protein